MKRTPIEELNLSARVLTYLRSIRGIETIEELVNRTDKDLLSSRNFDQKNLDELKEALKKRGLSIVELIPKKIKKELIGKRLDRIEKMLKWLILETEIQSRRMLLKLLFELDSSDKAEKLAFEIYNLIKKLPEIDDIVDLDFDINTYIEMEFKNFVREFKKEKPPEKYLDKFVEVIRRRG